MRAALRNVLLFAVVAAAFAGAGYAALQALDTPDAAALRAERARENAELDRKARKAQRATRKKARAAAARRPAPKRKRWGRKADAVCDRTYDDAWKVIDQTSIENPQDVLSLLDESLRLGDRLILRLERLGPAPNRRAHKRLLGALRASQARDRDVIRSLRAAWDPSLFVRRMQESAVETERLRGLSFQLGSVGCGELFDPAKF